jgi:D-alanyl-D-alanine carboxypeptidase
LTFLTFTAAILLLFTGCRQLAGAGRSPGIPPSATPPAPEETLDINETEAAPLLPAAVPPTAGAIASPTPSPPTSTSAPILKGTLPACGQLLPILADYDGPLVETLNPDPQAVALLRESVPEEALPALERLLEKPGMVGLAAYRVGQEDGGAYLNADVPMPLASVVKVIHLVAYAEAVAEGRLFPTSTILLEDLEAFYLPNIDLGAHDRALTDLEDNERIFGDPPAALLDVVPGMMISQSSNAATDYLHLLLGQREVEETAVALGLESQTAPCPFLGQFLIMANHVIKQNNPYQAWEGYMADPDQYGRDVMLLTEAFSSDAQFRETAVDWRRQNRQPNGQTQRLFSQNFNAQGSANDYANLMARIAQNGLSSADSSFTVRRFLEWPMRFDANQALFSNLGYKNGSLPGILTTVYYAYPLGGGNPVVVALFYRDLEGRTYRQWRDNLAHDELARWLLHDPQAIQTLAAVLEQ